jgi:transcriptional regulator with XRE-family HTH domain
LELRRLRRLAGLSGAQLAQALGVSQSRVSRTEVGAFGTNMVLVAAWLAAVGASAEDRDSILVLADEALIDVAPYRRLFRGSMLTVQRERIRQDEQAEWIRHFQPAMIPGPLQTAAYARAVLTAAKQDDEGDIEEAVVARLERGERLLAAGAARYDVIVTEAALRWWPLDITQDERTSAW